jgi:hypothetical protein
VKIPEKLNGANMRQGELRTQAGVVVATSSAEFAVVTNTLNFPMTMFEEIGSTLIHFYLILSNLSHSQISISKHFL